MNEKLFLSLYMIGYLYKLDTTSKVSLPNKYAHLAKIMLKLQATSYAAHMLNANNFGKNSTNNSTNCSSNKTYLPKPKISSQPPSILVMAMPWNP